MGINIGTEIGEETQSSFSRTPFPPNGPYEILMTDTEVKEFEYKKDNPAQGIKAGDSGIDNYIVLTLMGDDGETHVVKYRYAQDDKGKIKPGKAGGKLRAALNTEAIGKEGSWDIEGLRLNFETVTLPTPGQEGKTWNAFLPVGLAGPAEAGGASSNGNGNGVGYNTEAVQALIQLVADAGDEGIDAGMLFKEAVKIPAVKADKVLYTDLAGGKAYTKIEGIKKNGKIVVLAAA